MVSELDPNVPKKIHHSIAMAATNMECHRRKLLNARVLERFFHAIQSVTLQAIKAGHENGLGMRLMK